MSATSHEDIQELLGAYALDAVDDVERGLVDEHLATCPRCRAEVNDHRETAALLAFAGQPAPVSVWRRIEESLEEPPPPINLEVARTQRQTPPAPPRRWRSGGLIAAAAVVISVLALSVALRDSDADPSIPDGPRIHLASTDGRHSADIVIVDDRGYVFNDNLPALESTEVYQLWGKRGPDLISLGLLGNDPEREQFVADERFEAYAVTVEKAGGVVSSVQEPVLFGDTTA